MEAAITGEAHATLFLSFPISSPANAEAASLYRENMKEYVRRVKATVEQSWLDEGEDGGGPPDDVETGGGSASGGNGASVATGEGQMQTV